MCSQQMEKTIHYNTKWTSTNTNREKMEYGLQEPYATLALGGYNGKFMFIDRSCGYCIIFLVKTKKEATSVYLK